jgi:hypothetical protein
VAVDGAAEEGHAANHEAAGLRKKDIF